MKHLLKTILTAILIFVLQSASAQTKAQLFDTLFTGLYNRNQFNGNVLIAEKGNIVFQKSYGLADEATGRKLNDSTVFYVGGLTIPFTTIAVMQLSEQGKIGLDDKMSKYLPELKYYDKITVRHLLNLCSGLPDFGNDTLLIKKLFSNLKTPVTNKDLVAAFARENPALQYEPNTRYEQPLYRNTEYAFLTTIIERVSGITYPDYIKKNILQRLGMKNTYLIGDNKIPNLANGYFYSDSIKKRITVAESEYSDWTKKYAEVYYVYGTTGIYSTNNDLLKLDRALYTNKLLSSKSIAEMETNAVLKDKTIHRWGLGWAVASDNSLNGKRVQSEDMGFGRKSLFFRSITNDKTVIILGNNSDNNGWFSESFLTMLNRTLLDIKTPPVITLPENELEKFVGFYESEIEGNKCKIELVNGKLCIPSDNNGLYVLNPVSSNKFITEKSKQEFYIEFLVTNGRVEKFTMYDPEMYKKMVFNKTSHFSDYWHYYLIGFLLLVLLVAIIVPKKQKRK